MRDIGYLHCLFCHKMTKFNVITSLHYSVMDGWLGTQLDVYRHVDR